MAGALLHPRSRCKQPWGGSDYRTLVSGARGIDAVDLREREAVYKICDGREIPVLFSSAVIGRGTSAVGGIVYAAHDLTELKATEARGAFIRETFGRYVSDDVVATLLGSPEGLKLGGELRRVTVMMSDLRGFTALAERLTPEEAIRFLNAYLQTMVDLILHYRGTINEIMGDGILVSPLGHIREAPPSARRTTSPCPRPCRSRSGIGRWDRRPRPTSPPQSSVNPRGIRGWRFSVGWVSWCGQAPKPRLSVAGRLIEYASGLSFCWARVPGAPPASCPHAGSAQAAARTRWDSVTLEISPTPMEDRTQTRRVPSTTRGPPDQVVVRRPRPG